MVRYDTIRYRTHTVTVYGTGYRVQGTRYGTVHNIVAGVLRSGRNPLGLVRSSASRRFASLLGLN